MSGGIKRFSLLIALVAASLTVAAPATSAGKRQITAANQLEASVLVELNNYRKSHGLVPLRTNSKLRAAADAHSAAMGTAGFFAHDSQNGTSFWKRVERYYGSKPYGYWSVGENLLWASGDLEASAAIRMWINSPKHRENMLTARWREVGLSVVRVAGAGGVFGGLDVTIGTADFGVRR